MTSTGCPATDCPKCCRESKKTKLARKVALNSAYGRVTAEAYARMIAEAARKSEAESARLQVMREYYEIGIDHTGAFKIRYQCECVVCGFKYKFEHDEDLLKGK